MRRNRFLLAVTAVAVLSSGLTWLIGQQIQVLSVKVPRVTF